MTTVRRRVTQQQRVVAEALEQQNEFVSAQGLYGSLRADGKSVGLATVYRALQAMAEDGDVDVIRTGAGEAVYRQCSTSHHHHLVCRVCGRTVEVVGPAVERWSDKVGAENGFVDVDHTLEISGVCAECHRSRS